METPFFRVCGHFLMMEVSNTEIKKMSMCGSLRVWIEIRKSESECLDDFGLGKVVLDCPF